MLGGTLDAPVLGGERRLESLGLGLRRFAVVSSQFHRPVVGRVGPEARSVVLDAEGRQWCRLAVGCGIRHNWTLTSAPIKCLVSGDLWCALSRRILRNDRSRQHGSPPSFTRLFPPGHSLGNGFPVTCRVPCELSAWRFRTALRRAVHVTTASAPCCTSWKERNR